MSRCDEVFWFDLGLFPADLGLCTSEAAWSAEMRRNGWTGHGWLGGDARAMTFAFTDVAPLRIMVQVGARTGMSNAERIAIIVHEAQHVWQHLRDHTLHSPRRADRELEAYTVQWLTWLLLRVLARRKWVSAR